MELADVTDSKSVGSNTVRVRPPPSAPKSVTPLNEWGYTFCVLVGGRTRNLRVVHGCTMAVAQSRRKDAPTPTTAIRHPATLPLPQTGIALLFLVRREGEPATCGSCMDARWRSHKVGARMRRPQRPQTQGCVIVLAQSFARCETNRASTIRQPRHTFANSTAGYYFW